MRNSPLQRERRSNGRRFGSGVCEQVTMSRVRCRQKVEPWLRRLKPSAKARVSRRDAEFFKERRQGPEHQRQNLPPFRAADDEPLDVPEEEPLVVLRVATRIDAQEVVLRQPKARARGGHYAEGRARTCPLAAAPRAASLEPQAASARRLAYPRRNPRCSWRCSRRPRCRPRPPTRERGRRLPTETASRSRFSGSIRDRRPCGCRACSRTRGTTRLR